MRASTGKTASEPARPVLLEGRGAASYYSPPVSFALSSFSGRLRLACNDRMVPETAFTKAEATTPAECSVTCDACSRLNLFSIALIPESDNLLSDIESLE